MLRQSNCRLMQIAAVTMFQKQTHQIDHAVFGFFKIRAQKLGTKIARYLHHAFGRIAADDIQLCAVDDVILNTILHGFFKKRPRIVKRYA